MKFKRVSTLTYKAVDDQPWTIIQIGPARRSDSTPVPNCWRLYHGGTGPEHVVGHFNTRTQAAHYAQTVTQVVD
jgi:hypothetical protein